MHRKGFKVAPTNAKGVTRNEKAAINHGLITAFHILGGADGTRTRDPRRDRPVF